MTELEVAHVRRKLARIARDLDDLEEVEGLSLEEYTTDRLRRKAAERLLQETVEAAVDVNLHVLRALDLRTPADYYGSFIEMGRAGVLPEDLAATLAPATGLRYRLIHEYDQIDDAVVLEAVGEARRGFARHVSAVRKLLEEQGPQILSR